MELPWTFPFSFLMTGGDRQGERGHRHAFDLGRAGEESDRKGARQGKYQDAQQLILCAENEPSFCGFFHNPTQLAGEG